LRPAQDRRRIDRCVGLDHPNRRRAAVVLGCGLLVVALAPWSPWAPPLSASQLSPGGPRPFGRLSCEPRYGIRLCVGGQVNGKDRRVPSFDGVPLDADVALPATGRGPFPLIVMLHGLGGSKTVWETTRDDGLLDDVTFAAMGYAVLMYTARGFGDSCGTAQSRVGTPACAEGYIHVADQRYEIHDTQYLAGMLVDEGIAQPDIAVLGISYGAAEALELAVLKNRVREPDGSLVPWRSPKRRIPMEIAAAYAEWPWDDLASALAPNGRLLTATDAGPQSDLQPVGVEKQSWADLLYSASTAFYLPPPGAEATANMTDWFDAISAGEPYGAPAEEALQAMQEYHSPIDIPMPAGGPAPTVIQNGWTDTLFPVSEALHYADKLQAAGVHSPLLMIFDDVGHGWAQNKAADVLLQNAKVIAFLNAVMLQHSTPETGVIAVGTTCPKSAPSGPLLDASTFAGLQAGALSFGSPAAQVVTSSGGSRQVAAELNPVYAPYCRQLPGAQEPGTAVYQLAVAQSTAVVGGLLIHAELHVTGRFPELIGRLWDLNPKTGYRQLIEAGDLRPSVDQVADTTSRSSGRQSVTFQLEPNLYTVPAGHILELELVGSTAPWFRASSGRFRITLTGLTATIGRAKAEASSPQG
jgi:pimeloyl-ACP methyl ester carboxylesterase